MNKKADKIILGFASVWRIACIIILVIVVFRVLQSFLSSVPANDPQWSGQTHSDFR